MPATSRKRNKGKERKAKQAAKKEENERSDAHEFWKQRFWSSSTDCDHGFGVRILLPDGHPVSNMDQLIINLKSMAVSEVLSVMSTTHPHYGLMKVTGS